ncbi:MAG: ATP-grasp domain-containing protein [Myxococcota bacterium]
MPHVIFVAPHFPANQRRFVDGLKRHGATVTGIGDSPIEHVDPEVRGMLDGYELVHNVTDPQALLDATRRIQARGPWVDRIEATIESHMLPTAMARQASDIPGPTPEQITLCRDKFVMKQFLRERGIPCARNAIIANRSDLLGFIEEVGYPIVLKPRDGAGAHATYRIEGPQDAARALAETRLDETDGTMTAEQFVSGHEGFFDSMTVKGEVRFEFVTHYYPNVLEAMRTRWISPQMVHTNRIDAQGYAEVRDFGRRVIAALDLETTATHMEWFAGDMGLWFSEIGARPPGCNHWDVYCEANDLDLYGEWARAMLEGRVEGEPSKRFAAGLVNLRPSQDGTITGYSGVEEMFERYGSQIFKHELPNPGTPTQPVEAGYLANAWVCVKDPDYDRLREILNHIGESVRVWAS